MDHMTVTKYWSYCQADVTDIFLRLPTSVVEDLREKLTKAAGRQISDNKTAFEFYDGQMNRIYVSFWDCRASFGRSITEHTPPYWTGEETV